MSPIEMLSRLLPSKETEDCEMIGSKVEQEWLQEDFPTGEMLKQVYTAICNSIIMTRIAKQIIDVLWS